MIQLPIDIENEPARSVRLLQAWYGDTVEEFAQRFDVTREVVSTWRHGVHRPNRRARSDLKKLAERAQQEAQAATNDQQEGSSE